MDETREIQIPSMVGPSRRKRRVRRQPKRVNVVAGMKWCPKCETQKPVEAFGVARTARDGRNAYCRTCRTSLGRQWRVTNADAARAEVRARHAANPALSRAKRAVQRALASGKIARPAPGTPCACGRVAALEAHHHLGHAREHWLDVVWCCRSCRALANATARAAEMSVGEISPREIAARSRPTLKPVPPRWATHGPDSVASEVA